MKILRTPDECFNNLDDYPFEPNYIDIEHNNHTLRMHYLDENSESEEIVLLMHGEPTWSYLYRKIIPILVSNGKRVIAPDLIGFGKSDKPSAREDYSYANHIMWVETLIKKLDLKNIIFFAQDWGGLIGLRLLAKYPHLYEGLVVSNSGLPVGSGATEGFMQWLHFSQNVEDFDCGKIVNQGSLKQLNEAEIAAYNAPFPDDSYKAGPRVFPTLVPITKEHPQVQENIEAWGVLRNFDKPTITLFGEHDMAFIGGEKFFIEKIPGAKDMHHQIINAGHFSQENQPELIAKTILSI
jgi:haloalkane dehalogenase